MKKRMLAALLAIVVLAGLMPLHHAHAATRCVYCGGDGEVTCPNCGGSGSASGSVRGSCYQCHGSGYVTCSYCRGTGYLGADLGGDDGGDEGGGGGGDPEALARLSMTELTLVAGRSQKLEVTGTSTKPRWSSSNKAVATVSSRGKVTAKKAGKATITAKVGSKKLKCTVRVKKKVYISGLKLDKTSCSLIVGESTQVGYTIKPNPEKITESYAIKWSSNKPSVATVDQNGVITARGTGAATITAKLKIKTGTYKKYRVKVKVKSGRQRFVAWFNSNSQAVGDSRVWYMDDVMSVTHGGGRWVFMKDEGYTHTSLTFNESLTGTVKVKYFYTSRFGGSLRVEATANVPMSQLRREGSYNWTFTSGDANNYRGLAETSVTALLSSTQVYLQDYPRVSWRDLGLTAY